MFGRNLFCLDRSLRIQQNQRYQDKRLASRFSLECRCAASMNQGHSAFFVVSKAVLIVISNLDLQTMTTVNDDAQLPTDANQLDDDISTAESLGDQSCDGEILLSRYWKNLINLIGCILLYPSRGCKMSILKQVFLVVDNSGHDIGSVSSESDQPQSDCESDYSSIDEEMLFNRSQREEQKFLQQLMEFAHDANLNKTTMSTLLSLLQSAKSRDQIPRNASQLLKQLDVQMYYDVYTYCSTCLSSLERPQGRCVNCSPPDRKPNSELILFSISDELQRVVSSNIQLIRWYSLPENQLNSDIVKGRLFARRWLLHCRNSLFYRKYLSRTVLQSFVFVFNAQHRR
jgi:hypothetical protein